MLSRHEKDPDQRSNRTTSTRPRCLVLSCGGPAQQAWTAPGAGSEYHHAAWPVCTEHFQRLRGGEACEGVTAPRSFRRWLLMGPQLENRPQLVQGQDSGLAREGPWPLPAQSLGWGRDMTGDRGARGWIHGAASTRVEDTCEHCGHAGDDGNLERVPGWCYACGFFFDVFGLPIFRPWLECPVHIELRATCPHPGPISNRPPRQSRRA